MLTNKSTLYIKIAIKFLKITSFFLLEIEKNSLKMYLL